MKIQGPGLVNNHQKKNKKKPFDPGCKVVRLRWC
jgi:hypothetical protein